ncbi:MAG: hypothetical protein Q9M91_07005 [Candidatus Dojkabacteria bacterium]|nr:hypothetical protein [Candidatus Dojkabacteria bacterium]MDQ7021541.1 hypothetical protein [Candidatus Dojkabacteria bacterium]
MLLVTKFKTEIGGIDIELTLFDELKRNPINAPDIVHDLMESILSNDNLEESWSIVTDIWFKIDFYFKELPDIRDVIAKEISSLSLPFRELEKYKENNKVADLTKQMEFIALASRWYTSENIDPEFVTHLTKYGVEIDDTKFKELAENEDMEEFEEGNPWFEWANNDDE